MITTLLRTLIVYVIIIIGLRIMGKRQISQLQTSELVVTLLISELAIMPIQNRNEPLLNGLIPMLLLIMCEVLVSFIMLRSGKFRKLICGKPIMVVENGIILQKQMRRLRMTTEDLIIQLRQNDIFYLSEVDFAIVETNGIMSVIKKAKYDYLTPSQIDLPAEKHVLELVVVSDGEISDHSLKLCGKTRQWVMEKIKAKNLRLSDIFIMTADITDNFTIIEKFKKAEK